MDVDVDMDIVFRGTHPHVKDVHVFKCALYDMCMCMCICVCVFVFVYVFVHTDQTRPGQARPLPCSPLYFIFTFFLLLLCAQTLILHSDGSLVLPCMVCFQLLIRTTHTHSHTTHSLTHTRTTHAHTHTHARTHARACRHWHRAKFCRTNPSP